MPQDLTEIPVPPALGPDPIRIHHPEGAFVPTPASRVALRAIGRHADRFRGRGLEWGSGSGILTIAAARIAWVEDVLGLELDPRGVAAAGENARRNGMDAKVRFVESDSYRPVSPEGRKALERFRGAADFILANPPSSSPVGDGFEVRRVVVRGAPEYLKGGGVLLLSVSTQYSAERMRGLVSANPGFVHEGVAATTDLVPFDMERPDLRRDVLTYAREEERGGLPYAFRDPRDPEREMTAVEAWAAARNGRGKPALTLAEPSAGLDGVRSARPRPQWRREEGNAGQFSLWTLHENARGGYDRGCL